MPSTLASKRQDRFPLDPFGAMPQLASRIEDLGGHEPAMEPGYAFRTVPVASPAGPAAIRIDLHDLAAMRGSLSVDLTGRAARPGETLVTVATRVMTLEDLQECGGTLTIPFTARAGLLYAVAGYIHEDGPVRASGIAVTLVAPDDSGASRTPPAVGVEPVALPRLASQDAPQFGNPVSQPMTRAQARDPDFRAWSHRLGPAVPVEWAVAYPLQVLARYGVLRPGARGLCLRGVPTALIDVLAAQGCHIQICRPAVEGVLELPVRPVDFALSIDLDGGAEALREAIHRARGCLAAGGLAIHVFALGKHHVRRVEIERHALDAIAFGHEVAQLKFGPGERRDGAPTPFCLIVRQA